MEKIIWNKYPEEHTNFICEIRNTGLWEKDKKEFGKWLLLFKPKEKLNNYKTPITAPTYFDILNLISSQLEVEKRNDNENYVYSNNILRPKEKFKKLNKIKELIDEIFSKWIMEDKNIKNGC